MRTQPKPIVALAAGALLFSGLLGQRALAQETLGTSELTSSGGSTEVSVAWTYTETANSGSPTGNTYEYTYEVSNPTSGVLESFSVGFDVTEGTVASGATVITGSVTGGSLNSVLIGPGGTVGWDEIVTKGNNTGTLAFESDYGPADANANANGTTPGPWASSNLGGAQVPVPSEVPEPASTSLLALGILLLPIRKFFLKRFGT